MRTIDATRHSAIGIEPHQSVTAAAQIMERAGVGALVVLDDHAVVGLVTDRDLVRRAIARNLPGDARIDAVMSTPVVTIDADADVREALALLGTHGLRRLPVLRHGEFVAMFTVDDALVAIARDLADVIRPITAELLFAHRDAGVPATVAE